jgi:hypothetical protein
VGNMDEKIYINERYVDERYVKDRYIHRLRKCVDEGVKGM